MTPIKIKPSMDADDMHWKLNTESFRWISALVVSLVLFSISKTWALADMKKGFENTVADVAVKVDSNAKETTAAMQAIIKDIENRAKAQTSDMEARAREETLRYAQMDKRIGELENSARTTQQILVVVEGIKTNMEYMGQGLKDLKQEVKEQKRGEGAN